MRKSFSLVKSPQQDLRDSTDLIIDTIHSAGTNNVIDAMYNASLVQILMMIKLDTI